MHSFVGLIGNFGKNRIDRFSNQRLPLRALSPVLRQ